MRFSTAFITAIVLFGLATYLLVVNQFPSVFERTVWFGDAGTVTTNWLGIALTLLIVIAVSAAIAYAIRRKR